MINKWEESSTRQMINKCQLSMDDLNKQWKAYVNVILLVDE